MLRLHGKTALVTGSSGGICSAIARTLHAHGARAILSGTREAVIRQLAEELCECAIHSATYLSDPH